MGVTSPLGLHRRSAYCDQVDELGARAAAKSSAILKAALDAAGIDWPECQLCGGVSTFAGVARGTQDVLWRCASCAHAGGWKMDLNGEIDFGADLETEPTLLMPTGIHDQQTGRFRTIEDRPSPLL